MSQSAPRSRKLLPGQRHQNVLSEVIKSLCAKPMYVRTHENLGYFAQVAAPALIRKDCEVLDHFRFNSASLRSFHTQEIIDIARRVVSSQSTSQPIRSIRIIGHADSEGTQEVNRRVGLMRALAVRQDLFNTINLMRPGLASGIAFQHDTRGEMQPVANNVTPRSKACNRRVEIYLNSNASSCPGCTFRCFFAEYDLRFLPGDTRNGIPANLNMTSSQKTLRTTDVNTMVSALLPRRNARAAAARAGSTLSPAAASSALAPMAQRLSTAQIELYRQCFPDGSGGINFDDFQRAFEQFANGELRDPALGPGAGGPNGGFYFLFAEFAFLCVDSLIDTTIWIRALRAFVKTQEIFIHVFRPDPHPLPPPVNAPLPSLGGTPRPLDGPSGFDEGNFRPPGQGQSNAARKAALRAKYASMGLVELRNAARDNLLRAQLMP